MTEIEKIVWCAKALWRLPKTLCDKYWDWRWKELAAKKEAQQRRVDEWAAARVALRQPSAPPQSSSNVVAATARYSSNAHTAVIRGGQYRGEPRFDLTIPGDADKLIDYIYGDEP